MNRRLRTQIPPIADSSSNDNALPEISRYITDFTNDDSKDTPTAHVELPVRWSILHIEEDDTYEGLQEQRSHCRNVIRCEGGDYAGEDKPW